MVTSRIGRPIAVIPALVAASLLAGCGSGAAASNGVAAKSASQIYSSARAATAGASSVHYSGQLLNGGKTIALDIVAAGTRGGGTITFGGSTLHVVTSGTSLFLKATAAAWQQLGAPAATAKRIADRWLQTTTTNQTFGSLANFTNQSKLVGSITTKHRPTKGNETSIGGQKAITLIDKGNGELFVATTGKPYILEIKSTQAGNSGTVTFSDYNTAKPAAVPSNAESMSSALGS
jgi:hypothetical protein